MKYKTIKRDLNGSVKKYCWFDFIDSSDDFHWKIL
jgi:hypothetical protein